MQHRPDRKEMNVKMATRRYPCLVSIVSSKFKVRFVMIKLTGFAFRTSKRFLTMALLVEADAPILTVRLAGLLRGQCRFNARLRDNLLLLHWLLDLRELHHMLNICLLLCTKIGHRC